MCELDPLLAAHHGQHASGGSLREEAQGEGVALGGRLHESVQGKCSCSSRQLPRTAPRSTYICVLVESQMSTGYTRPGQLSDRTLRETELGGRWIWYAKRDEGIISVVLCSAYRKFKALFKRSLLPGRSVASIAYAWITESKLGLETRLAVLSYSGSEDRVLCTL